MARFVSDNPKNSRSLTIVSGGYIISSTGASGTVNVSTNCSAMKKGDSVILGFAGGTAGGFTNHSEYFIIPVASGSFKIAATQADAFAGTYISGASGNAGTGVAYPVQKVGGTPYIGTAGDLYVRGIGVKDTGLSSFSVSKNMADGSVYPFMIGDILGCSGSTASDIVVWCD